MNYKCKYYVVPLEDENEIAHTLYENVTEKDVFITINENIINNGCVDIYNVIEKHSHACLSYVELCKEITLEEYKRITKGFYTPKQYLQGANNKLIIYEKIFTDHREIDEMVRKSELYTMYKGCLLDNFIIIDEDIHIDDYSAMFIICEEVYVNEWTSHTRVIMTDSEELMLEYQNKWEGDC